MYCSVPDKFLLYADVNTVKMLHLDDSSQIHTLLRGTNDANYVAVAYDPLRNTLYLSDVTGWVTLTIIIIPVLIVP